MTQAPCTPLSGAELSSSPHVAERRTSPRITWDACDSRLFWRVARYLQSRKNRHSLGCL